MKLLLAQPTAQLLRGLRGQKKQGSKTKPCSASEATVAGSLWARFLALVQLCNSLLTPSGEAGLACVLDLPSL